jgi:uncharacterized protein
MSIELRRSRTYQLMPWKNGGGETCEIAAFPKNSDLNSFGWRISMARVASDGPFSVFPGIERTLTIIDGNGLWLTINNQERQLLQQDSEPLSFSAEAQTSSDLVNGAVTDLNVMTRRGAFVHQVSRFDCSWPVRLEFKAAINAIFCLKGEMEILLGTETTFLENKDCALIRGTEMKFCIVKGKSDVQQGQVQQAQFAHIQIDPVTKI